jgi:uncharacterized protein (DUF885 family)
MNIQISRRDALAGVSTFAFSTMFGASAFAKATIYNSINALTDKIAYDMLRDSPETCTSFALDPKLVGGAYVGKVSDLSQSAAQKRNQMVAGWIKDLKSFPQNGLSQNDILTRKVALSAANYAYAAAKFGYGDAGYGSPNPYVVSQLTGAYVGFPDFMASQHVVKTKEDADGWISRLKGFAKQLQDNLATVKSDVAKGVIPPDFIIDTTLVQLKSFIEITPRNSVLVTSLVEKANGVKLDGFTYGMTAEGIVKDEIYPQYAALIAFFADLRKKATHDAGVWRLPKGDDYYKTALAYWTTTNKSPDEVHETGKKLVTELQKQMDASFKEIGYTEGAIAERMQKLYKDPQYLYPNDDAGRAKLLSDINGMVKAMYDKLPLAFDTLPKAGLEVKRVPPYTEAGAPGGYYNSPAPDGSRPGAYYINLRDTAAYPRWTLPTLTYHEGVPGHHLQIALAQEAKGLPFLRSKMLWFGAYGEGWALYSETVADELGMYKNDPAGRIGYLQSMAFRASRLVCDTGMHAKKWSKEQAIEYMHQATGDTIESITTEIERYCVWPGQACCYMVGRIKIMELREKAKAQLGAKFNLKAFHDKVLLEGPMPLDVLEDIIDDWIKSVKA